MSRAAITSSVIAAAISVVLSGALAYFISTSVSDRMKSEIMAEMSGIANRVKLDVLSGYSSKIEQMQEDSIY